MIRINNLSVSLDTPLNADGLTALAARRLRIASADIVRVNLRKKSVDARDKRALCFVLALDVCTQGDESRLVAYCAHKDVTLLPAAPEVLAPVYPPAPALRPVVVGTGPAGLFGALRLAEAGWRPIVLERGYDVATRQRDVNAFWRGEGFNPRSNVQFGEGGAGTFSDGKLNTGIKDPRCAEVLRALVAHGAPEDILYTAKPHVGTDLLSQIVVRLRQRIEQLGGEVRFGAQVVGLRIADGAVRGISVATDAGTEQLDTNAVLLAIGHSARDTYEMLHTAGVVMIQKPFSLGARIEHPQRIIDQSQYGASAGHPALGAAEYKLAVHLPSGRDVYTFCMCPGGQVVAAASEIGGVCTNGMSARARDGANANSAVLVGISPADFPSEHPLAGVHLQRQWEQAAFRAASGDYRAPAQLVGDLLAGRDSARLGDVQPTYLPGVALGNLRACLPDFVVDALREGLARMDRQVQGFAAHDALLTGPETRSSSPVRIPRDEHGQASIRGLFPAGEGAGYAGGILSAAVDGLKMAECVFAVPSTDYSSAK